MIRKVTLRRFKRFEEVEFVLPGHIVLAGPNNSGKTTLLQAIAAWDLALRRWRELNDTTRHKGAYSKAPMARHDFSAVAVRQFDLLWTERNTSAPLEIAIESSDGYWSVTMEFIPDTTEQILVRPNAYTKRGLEQAELRTVFVPPMTGLVVEEPLYATRAYVDSRLSQGRPGEVLRNILVEASNSESAWPALTDSIQRLFGYLLLPPDAKGAHIVAEYQTRKNGPRFDIASAGSGFQQVLMLLTYLNTRPGAVLLLDEPDAHLHVILQDAIYSELRSVAARNKSQLVIATHSEVVINAVDVDELYVMLDRPRPLADTQEKALLIRSLGALSNEDVMLAKDAPGVLYLEDYTDLQILREWARILDHPVRELLTTRLFWKKAVHQQRPEGSGIRARQHFEALKLVRDDLRGLELEDGDARAEEPGELTGQGYQRMRWRRYEIESYLLHPAALDRFVVAVVGPGERSQPARADMRAWMEKTFRSEFLASPFEPEALVENYLRTTKARTEILPPLLTAAGLPAFPYTRYHEIAALMTPDEIHPEVREKLDGILKAFGL